MSQAGETDASVITVDAVLRQTVVLSCARLLSACYKSSSDEL